MSLQPVSVSLKFAFLAVLYLFLVWVAFSAIRDLRRGRGSGRAYDDGYGDREPEGPYDATGMYSAAQLGQQDHQDREPRLLVERAAGHESGVAYDLSEPVTLGRGNVEIHLEDPFASSHHARITPEGSVVVIEDLGSTNGTYLNDSPLSGPQPLHDGDRIRIGDSEFSYLQ
ncbi:MAG TPA: FHA domain-containing protein [Solirubrobacteraceae bacterium]